MLRPFMPRRQAAPNSKKQFGMFIFADQKPETAAVVDIVAIHGLNGHCCQTWTTPISDGQEVNWLKDLLPKQIPNARIMSFGYNSAVQLSKSAANISFFADQLLEDLFIRRQRQEEPGRPIIFICHSLGGIVFKQALNRAFEKERYRPLLRKVVGVMFFGTPHRGSDLASWGTTFSNIIRFGTLGTTTNSKLSKDLESNSRILASITKSFVERGKGLEIYNFYETDMMKKLNCRVVEDQSAILYWPNETALPMNGDHRSICKFSDENEDRYQPVWVNLSNMARKYVHGPSGDKQMETNKLLSDLWTSNYEDHKGRNPCPVEGTCTWILRHRQYEQWLQTPSSFLWVSAHPGCGKSVLTSYLVDYHRQADNELSSQNVCFFFFKKDDKEQSNAIYAMQAVLHQLYKAQGSLAKHASKHLESGHSLDNLATLWEIFTQSVSDSHAKPTLCFIDALDECEPVSRKQLIRLMFDSFVTWGDGPVAKILIKILITSRPDNSIEVAFKKAQNQVKLAQPRSPQLGEFSGPLCSMIRLRGEDETGAITRDIELVVEAAIIGLVLQGFPEKLLTDIMAELINRADRTFLWTTLIIRLLQERTEAGASHRDLRAILQSRSIDAIYTELLKARKDPKKARKMLQIMIAVIRPLTVAELSVALAVCPDHDTFAESKSITRPNLQTFDNINSDLVYPLENHVKALGGHFVRIIKGRVYFVHETAREFLLRPTAQYRNAATTPTWDARSPNPLRSEEMTGLFVFELGEEAPVSSGSTINDANSHAMAEGLPLSPFNDHSKSGQQYIEEEGSIWQHTFSFSVSHALLLELCVTYLYCLAKNSKSGKRGQPPLGAVGEFFRYAAKSWISHFHRVCARIPSNALPYYYGLCHPKFHGFQAWILEVGLDAQTLLSDALGSTEDVQDRLLRLFQLDPDDVDFSRLGNDIDDDPIDTAEIAAPAGLPDIESIRIEAFSSKPSAQGVHNFPTHVDEFGFISLRTSRNGTRS